MLKLQCLFPYFSPIFSRKECKIKCPTRAIKYVLLTLKENNNINNAKLTFTIHAPLQETSYYYMIKVRTF